MDLAQQQTVSCYYTYELMFTAYCIANLRLVV